MTQAAKAATNKRNALRSTEPRTPAGKAITRLNATSQGLRAASPVVQGEDPTAWEEFRWAVVADLSPVGAVQTHFAEQAAVNMWRQRRVTAY